MFRFPEARPRKGFTLTEVLMAMFVMAIGMISLLALFPAAFQQAKWALDTEQVARAAANAQSMTEMGHMQVANISGVPIVSGTAQSVRNDDNYRPESGNANINMPWKRLAYNAATTAPLAAALNTVLGRNTFLVNYDQVTDPLNPVFRWTFNTATTGLAGMPANAVVKFPPVFVDPMVADIPGYVDTATTGLPFHVGADLLAAVPFRRNNGFNNVMEGTGRPRWSLGIPRFSLSRYQVDADPTGLRRTIETSMTDEINFDTNGQPLLAAGQFARQQRFTWAYMCHWPNYSNPDVCEVFAVMFNSRPRLNGMSQFPGGEVTYPLNPTVAPTFNNPIFLKGLTQASIPLGTTPQPINAKVGDWVLDSTLILPEYNPATPLVTAPFLDTYSTAPINGLLPGLVGGHFYKILDVSSVQGSGPFFQTITLDRPARSDGFTATIMSGVTDVITKSVGRMPQR